MYMAVGALAVQSCGMAVECWGCREQHTLQMDNMIQYNENLIAERDEEVFLSLHPYLHPYLHHSMHLIAENTGT